MSDSTVQTFTQGAALEYVRGRRAALRKALASGKTDLPELRDARLYAYAKGQGLGYQDPEAKLLSVDTSRRSATFVISSPKRDRQGDIVVPAGCLGTIEHYRSNPRVFFSHRSYSLPIGSARTPEGESTVKVTEGRIEATVYFHGLTEESEQIYSLVAARELEATSIGFLPLKARIMERPRQPEERQEIVFDFGGLIFDEWDLTEFSVVPIPANPEAVSLWLANGVEGKQLPDGLRKCFEPFAAPQKVWANGFSFDDDGGDTSPEPAPAVQSSTPDEAPPAPQAKETEAPHGLSADEIKGLTGAPYFFTHVQLAALTLDQIRAISAPAPVAQPVEAKQVDEPTPQAPATPPVVPYGLSMLRQLKDHMCETGCRIDNLMAPCEHEKLLKAVGKLRKRIANEEVELQELMEEYYPEHFGKSKPEDNARQVTPAPEPTSAPSPTSDAPPPVLDWGPVLAKLDELGKRQEATSDAFFRLTGRTV